MRDRYSIGEWVVVAILVLLVLISTCVNGQSKINPVFDSGATYPATKYAYDTMMSSNGQYSDNPYQETVGEVNVQLQGNHNGYIKGEFTQGQTLAFQITKTLRYSTERGQFFYEAYDDNNNKLVVIVVYGVLDDGTHTWEIQLCYPTHRHCILFHE